MVPGLADQMLRDLAPLLAEGGIDVDNLGATDFHVLQPMRRESHGGDYRDCHPTQALSTISRNPKEARQPSSCSILRGSATT
jgi:hypothetical protein